ncbi:MAG: NPCBM/NEW2 domain-containing protein [Candidatus Pristimantibacillus sp.]
MEKQELTRTRKRIFLSLTAFLLTATLVQPAAVTYADTGSSTAESTDPFQSTVVDATYEAEKDKAAVLNVQTIQVSKSTKPQSTAYDDLFKIPASAISSITNNGGQYSSSGITNAIDGSLSTHWETGRANSSTFTNEVILTFAEQQSFDRLEYATRQDSAKGKGFPTEFSILVSDTDSEDDFALAGTGTQAAATGDLMEFRFDDAVSAKRVKFVFTQANQGWASAAEFSFYKEDVVLEKLNRIFTDADHNVVSDEFQTVADLNALNEEAKSHPLYSTYKEQIDNAIILLSNNPITSTDASVSIFDIYGTSYLNAYDTAFKMSNDNIASVTTNASHYGGSVIGYLFDENANTFWEAGTSNSASFDAEVVFTLNTLTTLNRMVIQPRPTAGHKGFPTKFSVYASKTSSGNTYELVTTGTSSVSGSPVEIQFQPTEFKRVKFVFEETYSSSLAGAAEISFYKEDTLRDELKDIFTDGTMTALKPNFQSLAVINQLQNEIIGHPLELKFREILADAEETLTNATNPNRIFTPTQIGSVRSKALGVLQMSSYGTELQSTGIYGLPGEVITVYLETNGSSKLPSLVFSQQEGSWNQWAQTVSLKAGKNVITVPRIYNTSWSTKPKEGGAIYIQNPYTAEAQGAAPIIRIEGGTEFPVFNSGDNKAAFITELTAYYEAMQADSALLDIFEYNSKGILYNGTASGAYRVYVTDGIDVQQSVNSLEGKFAEALSFAGLYEDAASPNNGAGLRTTIRFMQPYGFMYAASGHIGIQRTEATNLLRPTTAGSWGIVHELGHQLDIASMSYGEITNNMWSMHDHMLNGSEDRVTYDSNFKVMTAQDAKAASFTGLGYFGALGGFWQLEIAHPGYWAEFSSLYREKFAVPSGATKEERIAIYSSEVLGTNMVEHWERYGMNISDPIKAYMEEQYGTDHKKTWYLWTKAYDYQGIGFTANVRPSIDSMKVTAAGNVMTFSVDSSEAANLIGFEVYRDGQLLGFTRAASFTDASPVEGTNHVYEVKAVDAKLNITQGSTIQAHIPAISTDGQVVVALNQAFNPVNYVTASNYKGEDLSSSVTTTGTVDTTTKGTYTVTYSVSDQGSTVQATLQVIVVSDFTYLSDLTPTSTSFSYGSLQKDLSPSGRTITLLRNGNSITSAKGLGAHANSTIIYNIEGKDYETFESYIGIDQAVAGSTSASVMFQVYVDGVLKYQSPTMKSNTNRMAVSIPVQDANEIKLVVTDAGNGNGSDHAVWADAKFTDINVAPTLTIPSSVATKLGEPLALDEAYSAADVEDGDLTAEVTVAGDQVDFNTAGVYQITYSVTDSDGNTTTSSRTVSVVDMNDAYHLSDVNWTSVKTSYTAVVKDKSISNKALRLTGDNNHVVTYEKGLGVHSTSTIVYDLTTTNYSYFTAYFGVDRQMHGSVGSVNLQVYLDNKLVHETGTMNSTAVHKFVEVNLAGAKELKLVVTDGGNGNGSDHATLGNPLFHYAN